MVLGVVGVGLMLLPLAVAGLATVLLLLLNLSILRAGKSVVAAVLLGLADGR